jgi:hypothetical protein
MSVGEVLFLEEISIAKFCAKKIDNLLVLRVAKDDIPCICGGAPINK